MRLLFDPEGLLEELSAVRARRKRLLDELARAIPIIQQGPNKIDPVRLTMLVASLKETTALMRCLEDLSPVVRQDLAGSAGSPLGHA